MHEMLMSAQLSHYTGGANKGGHIGRVASPSAATCETDTIVLLRALAVRGHKTSLKKAQLCQPAVQYLGHTLSGPTRVLTPSRIKAILAGPRRTSVLQTKTF